MTPIEATAIALSLEARIAVLWRQHQRDKGTVYWTPARHDRDMELRALLRVARSGRRLARATEENADQRTRLYCPRHLRWERLESNGRPVPEVEPEQADPVTAAKAVSDRDYHDWQAAGPV